MTKRHLYKSYVFTDKDPIIHEVGALAQDTGTRWKQIEENGGPKVGTLRGWFLKDVKRPQFATVRASLRAMGHDVVICAGVRRVSSVDRKGLRQYWPKPKKNGKK